MKNNRSINVCCLLVLAVLLLPSCKKEREATGRAAEITDLSSPALVQIYMAIPDAARNLVSVNGNRVTGTALSAGSLFPSTGYAAALPSGLTAYLLLDSNATPVQPPLSFAQNMDYGKNYTMFFYDTLTAPKVKTVQTNITIPTDTVARIRFANFIFSRAAVPAVDIYSKRRAVNLFTNVAVTDVTDFIDVRHAFNDTFYVRETGTTNLLAALNGLTCTQKRSYTLIFRGRYQSTTGTQVRTLSSFVNR